MKKIFLLLSLILATPLAAADDNVYYARCNIRVLTGFGQNKISWNNWLASSVAIPAGTPLTTKKERVERDGLYVSEMIFETSENKRYTMPDEPQEKYIRKEPLDLSTLSPEFKKAVKNAEPAIGMTKEQVFTAMCAPAYVMAGIMKVDARKTEQLGLDEIKQYDFWVYQRKKLGKKFVVEFNEDVLAGKIYWKLL
ncbi:MAG: hypothetical protein HY886_00030 [Deltaproteobacteria bacterium]|nr:hypothetical protein [Deltaproteobacteria bacterium]